MPSVCAQVCVSNLYECMSLCVCVCVSNVCLCTYQVPGVPSFSYESHLEEVHLKEVSVPQTMMMAHFSSQNHHFFVRLVVLLHDDSSPYLCSFVEVSQNVYVQHSLPHCEYAYVFEHHRLSPSIYECGVYACVYVYAHAQVVQVIYECVYAYVYELVMGNVWLWLTLNLKII